MHQVKKAGQPAAQYLLSLPQAFSVSPSTGIISQEKSPKKEKIQSYTAYRQGDCFRIDGV